MVLAAAMVARAEDVTAFVATEGRSTAWEARQKASSILERAGVKVQWAKSGDRTAGVAVRVVLAETTPEELMPGALAVAYPYSGCRKSIRVFADRVRQMAGGRFREETALLGYVLAHEIAHVLQGVDRHSDAGVMKAGWSHADRTAIYTGRLDFEEEDVRLMRLGLLAGACRSISRPLAAQSAGRQD
jgi:hypothetical protein